MGRPKLLFWVCWLGKWHTYRQSPIIKHFSDFSDIVIFWFNESYNYYCNEYRDNKNVRVFNVEVPWISWSVDWLDYRDTANKEVNASKNFIKTNFLAMDAALKFLWIPDLIISDYEPVSAQLSYSLWVPFITIDQQSKYFIMEPEGLSWLSSKEEIARLGMFFPAADERIACSFFNINKNDEIYKATKNVQIFPTIVREEIISLKGEIKEKSNEILIYISPFSNFIQSANEVINILTKFKNYSFSIFVSPKSEFLSEDYVWLKNIKIYTHTNENFVKKIWNSVASICTWWHTFLSEMMYLWKPLYVIPLNTYEQNYNAKIIDDNGFGIKVSCFEESMISYFLKNIARFKSNIAKDNKILNKELWHTKIIKHIELNYLKNVMTK